MLKEGILQAVHLVNSKKDHSEEVFSRCAPLQLDLEFSHYLMYLDLMDGSSVWSLFLWEHSVTLYFFLINIIAAAWSLFMIAESAIKAKVKNFSKLANHVGGKGLELFLQINILIYMWGSCISY